jgi:RecA/RadA recombinase
MISKVTLELLETLDVFLALASPGKPTLNTATRGDATPHSTASLLHISRQRPPETVGEVRKLTSALDVLSPDVQRGNGHLFEPGDTHTTASYWLVVIWSIASLGWKCGKDIARFWSQRSERYSDEGFEAAWNAYDSTRSRAIGIGSLFKLARERGWKDDALNTEAYADNPHYRVLTPSDVRELRPLSWRVKGILPEKGIAAIYGPPGSGKSFLATDAAAAISRGEDWFGHKTKQSSVVFLMLEGEAGVRNRIDAFEKTKGTLPDCFGVIVQPFEFLSGHDITNLKTVVPKGSVVVVDTLNRAAPTADENNSADMGAILTGAKALQSAIDGLVLIVHHTGKDSSKGLRGHSSLLAALDASIEVERNANQRSWRLAKSKDGVDGISVAFKLEAVPLGVDSDGDDVSSCVVLPDVNAIFTKTEPRGAQQRSALQRLQSLLSGKQLTTTGCGGAPPSTACMQVEDAVTAVAFGLTATPSNKRRNEARRIVKALINSEHLCSGLDSAGVAWCWV